MIDIKDKALCCGCSSCASVCPKACISMMPDEEGFLYPNVDISACVRCGACERVCPVINPPSGSDYKIQAYAMRTKRDDVLEQSTSGGFITPLAEWVFEHDGVLCAAAYQEDCSVEHIVITREKANQMMPRIRGSKYVQSSINDSFREIQKELKIGRIVCFVGTSCQVNGLISFLGGSKPNLITVDLVCHGAPSPKLWKSYLGYQTDKYGSKVVDASFRNKTYGYHGHTMRLGFANGMQYLGSGRIDPMMKSFMAEIASRPICYQCPFKVMDRCSDFTIFDCWHFSELVVGVRDDDKGYTNVFVCSTHGTEVLNAIRERYDMYPVDLKKAISLDGFMFLNAAHPHPYRDSFLQTLGQDEFMEHIQKYIPIKRCDYMIEMSKKYLYHPKISQMVKRLKKRRRNY